MNTKQAIEILKYHDEQLTNGPYSDEGRETLEALRFAIKRLSGLGKGNGINKYFLKTIEVGSSRIYKPIDGETMDKLRERLVSAYVFHQRKHGEKFTSKSLITGVKITRVA